MTIPATSHPARHSGSSARASSPATTSPGPVPAFAVFWARSRAVAGVLRSTRATTAGEANPAAAELSTAPAASIPGPGASAIAAQPTAAVIPAATTRARGCRAPARNPIAAARQ
ncbi:hypothetical protein Cde04nite_18120 [Cellulomonas denverensis]|nr:hypothetical protein Cde04nite_18120 [Cellulomonas denverensis]